MSEEASESGEVGEGYPFQIGDSVTAFTYPLTEGLIIARSVTEDARLELTLLVAPYKKRGQAWARASVITRDAARLSKKMPNNFNFPIKNVESLRGEVKKAKGDAAWVFATCVALDREFCGNSSRSGVSESEDHEDEEGVPKPSRVTSVQALTSEAETGEKKQEQLESRVDEVIKLKDRSLLKIDTRKERHNEVYNDSEISTRRKLRKSSRRSNKRKSKKKKKSPSSSDYSSSSSSSTSDSSRASGEVGEKGRSGRFTCPFHEADSRGCKNSKRQIKGQSVIRKHVRVALHNLYAEHTTLAGFASDLISKANSSPYKPFSTDTVWLTAYARNIDTILLSSLGGPWVLWNEPVLDDMVVGFLELVVRIELDKEYPICLDDSVRKWMRKKRVGSNPKYGPVSFAMQHAKFTDSGLLVYQSGWQKQRDRSFPKTGTQATPPKGSSAASDGGEKKSSPPSLAQ